MKYILCLVLGIMVAACCRTETIDNDCYPCYSCIDSAKAEAMRDIQAYKDSVQQLLDDNNMIIYTDSLHEAEVRFDSLTGIPYLIIKQP